MIQFLSHYAQAPSSVNMIVSNRLDNFVEESIALLEHPLNTHSWIPEHV